ncbi:hypothetical protein [Teredinibacter haidensis]|nr:hypothetical protein [Teredinibacter haidensis]
MNEVVMVGGYALIGSTGLIVVIVLVASAILGFLDPRIDHGDEH